MNSAIQSGMFSKIRPAHIGDLNDIAAIYDDIHTEIESGRAVIGWIRGVYPTRELAHESIRNREMYVLEDGGRIVACARINQYQGPEYNDAVWTYEAQPHQVLVLHTLVVSPREKGRGYGEYFARYYEYMAKMMGCSVLRIDTNALNRPARALYKKLGYNEACIIPTEFNGIKNVNLVCLDKRVFRASVMDVMRDLSLDPEQTDHDVQHFLRVHRYAKIIGADEHLDDQTMYILELAAVLHDIACPLCRKKYGSCIPEKQESEGAVMARDFLVQAAADDDVVHRVSAIVGRHHSYTDVDGMDLQILLEADYIAFIEEKFPDWEEAQDFIRRIFKTESGKALARRVWQEKRDLNA